MAGKRKNITDRAFGKSLKSYQQAPPEGVWTGIRDVLDGDRRRSRLVWIGRIAASAALLLAAGSVWVILHREPGREVAKTESGKTAAGIGEQSGTEKGAGREEVQGTVRQYGTGEEPGMQPGQEQEIVADREQAARNLPESASGNKPEKFSQNLPETVRHTEFPGHGGPSLESGPPTPREGFLSDLNTPGDDLNPEGEETSGYRIGIRPVRGITGVRLGGASERDYLLALNTRKGPAGERAEGIDVFEEFGEEGKADYGKWEVGGLLSPLYSYRSLDARDASYSTGTFNDLESGVLSYAGGINLKYSPARRLSVQSGIYFTRMGISISNVYMASLDETYLGVNFQPQKLVALSNSSGNIELGAENEHTELATWITVESSVNAPEDLSPTRQDLAEQSGELLQHFDYLEIPLILRYSLVDRRVGLNLLGGLSTNFLVGDDVYFVQGGSRENIGSTDELKTVNYSSVVGLGFRYTVKGNFSVNLEPTFRYYLNSINYGSGIGSHPYSIGFFTGLSYSF